MYLKLHRTHRTRKVDFIPRGPIQLPLKSVAVVSLPQAHVKDNLGNLHYGKVALAILCSLMQYVATVSSSILVSEKFAKALFSTTANSKPGSVLRRPMTVC